MEKSDIIKNAKRKTRKKKFFLLSFIFWVVFSLFFIYLDLNVGWERVTWAMFPIFGIGVIVLFQSVFAFDFFGLGNKWEKEEIQKEVEKRKKVLDAFEEQYGDLEELDLDDLKEIRRETRDTDFV